MTTKKINKTLLKAEHVEIDHLLAELYKTMAVRQAPRVRVVRLLQMLRERLVAHLNDEGRNGYFGERTRDIDKLQKQRTNLLGDHVPLLARLERIMNLAKTGTVQNDWWTELESLFREFGSLVIRHENNEQALLGDSKTNCVFF